MIPRANAEEVRANLKESIQWYDSQLLSEEEYEALIHQLVEENIVQTEPVSLSQEIKAEELNSFYRNVLLDLSKLYPEQNNIEFAGENYGEIFQGHTEELKKEIKALERSIERLQSERRGEDGLIIRGYSFEPEEKENLVEHYNEETAYLFTDRDGFILEPAEQNRLFHTYYLSLGQEEKVNLLESQNGQVNAKLKVVYESPYTLTNQNENYTIDKAIDGSPSTFWFNTALKPDNRLDSVSTSPRKGN